MPVESSGSSTRSCREIGDSIEAMILPTLALILSTQGGGKDYRAVVADLDHYRSFGPQLEALRSAGDAAAKLIFTAIDGRLKKSIDGQSLQNSVQALCDCATPTQSARINRLYFRVMDESCKGRLLGWLATVGNARECRSLIESQLLAEIKTRERATNPFLGGLRKLRPDELVVGLVRAGDQRSCRLLIGLLNNKTVDGSIRNCIYGTLASTGSPAAIRALRDARVGNRMRSPIPEVVHLRSDPYKRFPVKATYTDANGTVWGLVDWGGLADPNDLWLVRRTSNQWVDPVFTGYNAYWDTLEFGMISRTERIEDEAKLSSLIKGGGWVKELIGNEALRVDSDGDGLSDVAERTLRLNEKSADTDGDGLSDSVDKNPHTARSKLSETQRVLKGAFDAMAVGMQATEIAFVALPDDVQPFEVTTWPRLVLPAQLESKNLSGFVFTLGKEWSWNRNTPKGPPISFSADRKTARVFVTRLHGTSESLFTVNLKRFGDDWLPVKVENVGVTEA